MTNFAKSDLPQAARKGRQCLNYRERDIAKPKSLLDAQGQGQWRRQGQGQGIICSLSNSFDSFLSCASAPLSSPSLFCNPSMHLVTGCPKQGLTPRRARPGINRPKTIAYLVCCVLHRMPRYLNSSLHFFFSSSLLPACIETDSFRDGRC